MALELEKELLFQAMAAPIGIVVQTEELDLAQVNFGKARKAEPSCHAIEVRRSPRAPLTELWLVKTAKIPLPPAPAPSADIPPPAIQGLSLKDLGL